MKLLSAFVTSAALLLVLQPAAGEDFEDGMFSFAQGHFRCELPTVWKISRDEHEEERTHCYGVFLVGPQHKTPLPPTISARFFAPDNVYFRDAEHYLRRQLEPGLIQLQGETTSEPEQIELDGRPATTFVRETFEYFPPDSLDTKQIPVREEYYVVPHKGGFVVVIYKAPILDYDYWRPALERLLDTFRLLPENVVIPVRTAVGGSEAEEVEAAATRHLEGALHELSDLNEMRSVSYPDESVIWLKLEHGADIAAARQEIDRLLATLKGKLPAGAVPLVEPPAGDEPQLLLIAVCNSDDSKPREAVLTELETLNDRVLRDRLAAVPGVASVEVVGGGQRIEIIPSLDELAAKKVGVQELAVAVRQWAAASDKAPSAEGAETAEESLRNMLVTAGTGESVRVGDVARVQTGRAGGNLGRLWFADSAGGRPRSPAAVLLAVRCSTETDAGAVYRAVDGVLSEVRTTLPGQVTLASHVFTAADFGALMEVPFNDDAEQSPSKALERAAAEVCRLPGVKSAWRLDLPGDLPSFDGPLRGTLLIEIEPEADTARDAIADSIRQKFADESSLVSPGRTVAQPGQFPGVQGELIAVLTGPDLEIMRREAEGVLERIGKIPGIVDLQLAPPEPGQSLRFTVKPDDAKRYGLESAEVLQLANAIAYRRPLAKIAGPAGRPINVILMLEHDDPAELARLPLRTAEGATVTLDRVAEISTIDAPQVIFHQNGWRAVVVAGNVRDRDPVAALINMQNFCFAPRLPGAYTLECKKE